VRTPSPWPSRGSLDWREESLGPRSLRESKSVDVLASTMSFRKDGRRPMTSQCQSASSLSSADTVDAYSHSRHWRSSFNLHANDDPPPLTPAGRATTRAQLHMMRRRQAMAENATWFDTTRSVLPQGRTLGSPGKSPQAERFTHLDDSVRGRTKWWGTSSLYAR
jgi:hypothetical protein